MNLKSLKKSLRERPNGGLSLIELIISVAILGIVSAMLLGFVSAGAKSFNGLTAVISLQSESRVCMNQVREYAIDCDGSIRVTADTLYILGGDGDAHVFSFDSDAGELTYTEYSVAVGEDGEITLTPKPDMSGLVSTKITRFIVTRSPAEGESVSSLELTMSFSRRDRSVTATEVIALRNDPVWLTAVPAIAG